MTVMVDFSKAIMAAVADFLMTEPISYLFGLICFLFIVKAFKILMTPQLGRRYE